MKILLATLGIISFSTAASAGIDCTKTANEVAKMNMDSRAKAYGFDESYIDESSLTLVSSDSSGSAVYTVTGFIYKAEYAIQMQLDSLCGVESVTLTDVAEVK